MRRAFLSLLLALALLGAGGPRAEAQPPLWVVRAPGVTIYLFGSVHLLPAGLDWRPPALDAALGEARELWFEVPITAESDNAAAADTERRGQLRSGVALSSLMPPEEVERLHRVADSLHLLPAALDRMQPWRAEVTLSLAADAQNGADSSNGVEEQIQAVAAATAKRRAFETARQQVGFLAGAPLDAQLASLVYTLHEIEDDPDTYRRVVDEWMKADVAGLELDVLTPLRRASPVVYDRLIVQRNRRWAKQIRSWLRHPGVVVAVVGAGHLIGPDGVPALLRADGVQVEGP